MEKQKIKEAVIKANCALELGRKIVGIKYIFTEDEFEKGEAKKLEGKMPYCVMVKLGMSGRAIKAKFENFSCLGGARALGILEIDEVVSSGRHYGRLGLYQDFTVAKNVLKNVTMCQHKAYGVMIKPVEEYDEDPDVVIVVSSPYNVMRLVQGYTYIFGCKTSYKMTGNQAFCSECTAYPFESNDINVSLLCSGTRFMGGWDDSEMAIGLPFNKFVQVIDGLYATINPTEPNKKKSEIEEKLKETDRNDLRIEFDKNYYTGLYLK